jgi:hypothetical protein
MFIYWALNSVLCDTHNHRQDLERRDDKKIKIKKDKKAFVVNRLLQQTQNELKTTSHHH